jgi:hypothetical protein
MSGWQRIGVVISVLWLVGLPVYVLNDNNQRVYNNVLDCITPEKLAGGATFDQVLQRCHAVYGPYLSWGDLARFFRDNVEMSTGFLLGPIILLWLVGWIVLGTVRWVRRGFTGPGR